MINKEVGLQAKLVDSQERNAFYSSAQIYMVDALTKALYSTQDSWLCADTPVMLVLSGLPIYLDFISYFHQTAV